MAVHLGTEQAMPCSSRLVGYACAVVQVIWHQRRGVGWRCRRVEDDVHGAGWGSMHGEVTGGCRRPVQLASGESELQCSAARFGAGKGDMGDPGRLG